MGYMFNNFVPSIVPNVPLKLKSKIKFMTSVKLTVEECQIMTICLENIYKILEKDNISNSIIDVFVCYTSNGSFGFESEGKCQGAYTCLAIYDLNGMRKLGAQQFAFAFTEELVHHFWRLEDETETKMKVIEILQLTEPCITKEYVKDWGLNWK